MRVRLDVVTMVGSEYVLWERDGGPTFPHGELGDGEAAGAAAKRIVKEWSGTQNPKLEILDLVSAPGTLTLVFRAMLVDEPKGATRRIKRMELPEMVGALRGRDVEEALKTSLAYKLTRG